MENAPEFTDLDCSWLKDAKMLTSYYESSKYHGRMYEAAKRIYKRPLYFNHSRTMTYRSLPTITITQSSMSIYHHEKPRTLNCDEAKRWRHLFVFIQTIES
ncbi:hypothetical protein DH09_00045 (plasmid) [Bacillaceae bacterium JMAK1]|nr:hypothetical protein DH09_00045 [Bacillaceae bacterium JMAK1]